MTPIRKKLIEVALPLEAINTASAREKAIRHGHPSTLHLWWARRPLAACRAVLFGQLVDDPSAWPDVFPGEEAQDRERQRLFRLIEQMVLWENSTNERVIGAARLEIARSIARGRKADGQADARDEAVLRIRPSATEQLSSRDAQAVNAYLAEVAPPVHDPFAGGGAIPLEAQRLGLRAIASDLNPVAVLINKAVVEIPPKFAGRPPVNPEAQGLGETVARKWKGAEGLAEDVRYYGRWMRDEACKRVGHLYPHVKVTNAMAAGRLDLKDSIGQELMVIAWIWARTVASPNPACGGAHVPLMSSFWLSKKEGKQAWVEPVVDRASYRCSFEVKVANTSEPKVVDAGTKTGRGDFQCIFSGDPIPAEYIRRQGQAGHIRDCLVAVVCEGKRGRVYLSPPEAHQQTARVPLPDSAPDTDLPEQALGFRVQNYGMRKHRDLFTPRQLTALVTFSDLVTEARAKAVADARRVGLPEGQGLEAGGTGAKAYGDAVAIYLAMSIDKLADLNNSLCGWEPIAQCPRHLFGRQAIPIVWDFAEANVFSSSSGSWETILDGSYKSAVVHLASMTGGSQIDAKQADAMTLVSFSKGELVSTDPPYYDNVPYADLSDFFYVWLRRSLRPFLPGLFSTMLVPKATELVAEPFRHGGKDASERFFTEGMTGVMRNIVATCTDAFPVAIYYAFKQSETGDVGTASTGWEMFLDATFNAGFTVCGTWPTSTENASRLRGQSSNALASSIVLVCRKRPDNAPTITRADFRRLLRAELPAALKALQHGNIAPVDLAQASIGPGMAVFSRHARVLEADGTSMTVRTALQLINQALDEYLTEQEGEFDGDTRFALTWFETRQYEAGPFGEAETLAKARNVSVSGVAEAGFLSSAAGRVRLRRRDELPDDWNPETDKRLTVWESTQHLIKRLEANGEQSAAGLLTHLRTHAAPARDLAYRLYTTCERKGWAEEARSYNGLVVSWPELEKIATTLKTTAATQDKLF